MVAGVSTWDCNGIRWQRGIPLCRWQQHIRVSVLLAVLLVIHEVNLTCKACSPKPTAPELLVGV